MRILQIRFLLFVSLLISLNACDDSQVVDDTFIKFFGGAFNQKAFDLQASPNGDFFVIVGSSLSFGINPIADQIFVITTDINGNRINQNSFGNPFLAQEGKALALCTEWRHSHSGLYRLYYWQSTCSTFFTKGQ